MVLQITKNKKRIILLSSMAIALIAVVIVAFAVVLAKPPSAQNDTQPPFRALLPANSTIDDFGGWKKLTPPSGESFFVYIDEIDSIAINVSQQPLPANFAGDVDNKVAEVAKGYNTSSIIDANGTKVHIGNSAKGPQSVIFTKNNLLVSIVSQKEIQNASWISYINSLQP